MILVFILDKNIRMIDSKKYFLAFIFTCAIFATAFFASNFFSTRRVETVKSIQDNIAIDILSSETQFDLLKEVSCSNVDQSILAPQLEDLGTKLSHTESDRSVGDDQIMYLKKYYSLLQIKDYLLSKKLAEKCAAKKPVFIIYFYSNKGDCKDCVREGYVLTKLKETYPDLRIYSFDYNLPLSAIDSMKMIYKIQPVLPALVIEDTTYQGYKSFDDLDKLLPQPFKDMEMASSTTAKASSTSLTPSASTTTKK